MNDTRAPVDSILECRWVIPVRPFGVSLADHAVAVLDGKIVGLAPIAQSRTLWRAPTIEILDRHALLPGFVNAHAHSAMALFRGVGDDLPLMRWLHERIWPLEKAFVNAEFVADGSRLAALEMIRGGTTTVSDMYFHPHASALAMRAMGMRVVIGIVVIEFPSSYATDAEDYLRQGLAAREALLDDPMVSFTLAPHAPYTVNDDTLRRVVTLSDELDLPIHMHVHETADEVGQGIKQYGIRPLERIARLGLVSPRLIAVHAVHLDQGEISLLARNGASVVHCPTSNLKLGSGVAQVCHLIDAGVNVAIGTDSAASNNRLDMLADGRLAALLAKGFSHDASALPASLVLDALTINGAHALGLESKIGSIEPGKEADLVAIDLQTPETVPLYDPISQVVHAAGREHVTDVWVAGKPVVQKRHNIVRDGRLPTIAILSSAGPWQNRLQQFLNKPDDSV